MDTFLEERIREKEREIQKAEEDLLACRREIRRLHGVCREMGQKIRELEELHPACNAESGVVLKFSGSGDDTFGEYNCANEDYDNCGGGKPIECIIDGKEKGSLMVIGQYRNGCWAVGVSKVGKDGRMPEDDPMPNWDVKITEDPSCPYSMMAVITIPDCSKEDICLRWFSNGRPVNAY